MKIRNPKSEIRNPPSFSRPAQAGAAFTIVELMVVVAIIIILIGIGLAVGPQLVGGGSAKLTKSTLSNLQNIAVEYQVLTSQNVNHLVTVNTPFDWANTDLNKNAPGATGAGRLNNNDAFAAGPPVVLSNIETQSLARFMYVTLNVQSLKKAYATVDARFIADKNNDGFLEILDGWQNVIVYVAYVRAPLPMPAPPLPLPPNDNNTTDDFLPLKESPYFASAGPDGKWGDVRQLERRLAGMLLTVPENQLADQAADNLYSFGTLER